MIDLSPLTRLSSKEVARKFNVHESCIHRWRTTGVDGVRLEFAKLGGRYFTDRIAVEAFVAATTAVARRRLRRNGPQAAFSSVKAVDAGRQLDVIFAQKRN